MMCCDFEFNVSGKAGQRIGPDKPLDMIDLARRLCNMPLARMVEMVKGEDKENEKEEME